MTMTDAKLDGGRRSPPEPRPARSLALRLRRLAARPDRGRPDRGRPATVGEALAALDDRDATSLVLLLLAVPAIVPTPGVPAGMVFGLALLVVALQLAGGRERPRLPGWLARRPLPRRQVARFTRTAAPHLRRLESRLRPRLLPLTAPRLLALPLMVLGLAIALPIPFGNMLPGLAVLVIALALGARDGAGVLLGLVAGLVGVAVPVALLALGLQLVATPAGGAA